MEKIRWNKIPRRIRKSKRKTNQREIEVGDRKINLELQVTVRVCGELEPGDKHRDG